MNRFYKSEDEKNLLSVITTERLKTLKYHVCTIKQ